MIISVFSAINSEIDIYDSGTAAFMFAAVAYFSNYVFNCRIFHNTPPKFNN